MTPDELRSLLDEAGFHIEAWSDTTDAARAWFAALADKIRKEGMPPLGFHVLLGSDFQAMAQNQRRNPEEGRMSWHRSSPRDRRCLPRRAPTPDGRRASRQPSSVGSWATNRGR